MVQQQRRRLIGGVLVLVGAATGVMLEYRGLSRILLLTLGPVTGLSIVTLWTLLGRCRVRKRAGSDATFASTGILARTVASAFLGRDPGLGWTPDFSGDVVFTESQFSWRPRRLGQRAGLNEIPVPWGTVQKVEVDKLPSVIPLVGLRAFVSGHDEPLEVRLVGVSTASVKRVLRRHVVPSHDPT